MIDHVFIYALSDPRDGRIRYVGKAKNIKQRLANHLIPTNLKRVKHSSRWLEGLRQAGLLPVLIVLSEVPTDEWEITERNWIERLKLAGHQLTNILPGGEGGPTNSRLGKPWTEIQRVRYRATRKGMKIASPSKEAIKLRGLAIKKHWDDLAKVGIFKRGPVRTKEFKLHMSKVMKGRKPAQHTIDASLAARKRNGYQITQKRLDGWKRSAELHRGRKHTEKHKQALRNAWDIRRKRQEELAI